MDQKMTALVAIGASAAVNCRPCLEHNVKEGERLGLSAKEMAEAVEVGLQVSRGARRQTRLFSEELLGKVGAEQGAPKAEACCESMRACWR